MSEVFQVRVTLREVFDRQPANRRMAMEIPVYARKTPPSEATLATLWPTKPPASPVGAKRMQIRAFLPRLLLEKAPSGLLRQFRGLASAATLVGPSAVSRFNLKTYSGWLSARHPHRDRLLASYPLACRNARPWQPWLRQSPNTRAAFPSPPSDRSPTTCLLA